MRTLLGGGIFALGLLLVAGCGGQDTRYSDAMAEQHAADEPEATAAAREPMMPVTAGTVPYAATEAGEPINGYMAAPQHPDSVLSARGLDPDTHALPGLIVIHEWWGLNENIRTATRRLAGEGYRVLAVDLYRGSTAETPDAARALMQTAMGQVDQMLANLRQAETFLREEGGANQVGIMGWCFGGGMSLNAALDQPAAYDALVIYYGRIRDAERSELAALQMPLLGHFGAEDSSIPLDGVQSFEATLDELDKTAAIYTYPAGHAFANPSGQNYNPEAAARAWDRTTQFLREHLYPSAAPASAASE